MVCPTPTMVGSVVWKLGETEGRSVPGSPSRNSPVAPTTCRPLGSQHDWTLIRDGDIVRIEMRDENGQSIFGTIDQQVVKYEGA